ncbi:hypothetical protein [Daejeonella lutea]|uniref:Uncharacterized protein n=1 Tax=Daejeonella lutea TaxID=572036 RepID=A0A1T5BH73_9SPHI|nr:hypothetical protein [Daejeonella lutea]SKB46634.1 hypothetical protein SAMN05661099_1570 [Daejeonella lutea]
MRRIFWVFVNILAFSPIFSKAQLIADTTSNSPGLAKALSYYIAAVGINAAIYSGSENVEPRYPIHDGYAFFETNEPVPGEILYDGILYKGVIMWYDIVRNEVVVQHPTMNSRIALNNKKVSYFRIGEHPFVPVNRELPGSADMPDKFYKVLHDGKTTLLGLYTKNMFEGIQESHYVTNYGKQQSGYFLQKNGRYQPVKSMGTLLNILGDKKQELQQHQREFEQDAKSNKIRKKETPEQSMVRVLTYYDKISL